MQGVVNLAKAAPEKRSRLQIVRGSKATTVAMSESRESRASPQHVFIVSITVEVASNQRGLRHGPSPR